MPDETWGLEAGRSQRQSFRPVGQPGRWGMMPARTREVGPAFLVLGAEGTTRGQIPASQEPKVQCE